MPNLLRQLLVHFFQTPTFGVAVGDEVFSCVDKLATFGILDVTLLR